MFLQSYQTARDKLLYKDGFLLKCLLKICWLVKIHRECIRAKENFNGKYEIKNPYSGNFRQLFFPFFCQLVLDLKKTVTQFPFIFNLC